MSTTKVTIIPSAQLRPALSSFRAPYSPPGWGVRRGGQPAADGSWGSEVLSPCEPLPSLDTGAGPSSVRGGPRSHPGAVVTRSRRGAHTGKVEAEVGQSHAVPHGHTHHLGHGAPTRDADATLRPHTPVSRAKVEQEESKRAPHRFAVIACWATYMQVFGYTRYIMETNFTGFIFFFFFFSQCSYGDILNHGCGPCGSVARTLPGTEGTEAAWALSPSLPGRGAGQGQDGRVGLSQQGSEHGDRPRQRGATA